MRPGAPEAPWSVWQVLQSPLFTEPFITRVFPPKLICARMGNTGHPPLAEAEKFPARLAVKVRVTLLLSVTLTTAPSAAAPLQSSYSCPVGYAVPAIANRGPSPREWQAMHASPGRMVLPFPPVQYTPLVQVGGPENTGSGVPASTVHVPPGIPALTQEAKADCFAVATGAAGGGGIGAVVLAIRFTQAWPVVTEELLGEAARSWASVVSPIGAPPVGGLP
jgi:hypothetical protein